MAECGFKLNPTTMHFNFSGDGPTVECAARYLERRIKGEDICVPEQGARSAPLLSAPLLESAEEENARLKLEPEAEFRESAVANAWTPGARPLLTAIED